MNGQRFPTRRGRARARAKPLFESDASEPFGIGILAWIGIVGCASLLFPWRCQSASPDSPSPPKSQQKNLHRADERKVLLRALAHATQQPGSWKPATPKDDWSRGAWWEIFRDPGLDQLEAQAELGNQSIRIALANVLAARAGVAVAYSAFFPHISLKPYYHRWRKSKDIPPISNVPSLLVRSNGTNGLPPSGTPIGSTQFFGFRYPTDMWQVLLESSWELDLWGKLRRQLEAAQAEAQATQAEFEAIRLSVHAELAQAYFLLRYLDRQLEIYRKMVAVSQDNLKRAQTLFQTGLATALDVARARTELARIQTALYSVENHRAQTENAIARLVGKPSSEFHLPPSPLKGEPPPVPMGLPSELLEHRPDIAAAEREVASANAEIGVAIGAFFPKVSLDSFFGYNSIHTGNLFTWPSVSWLYGPLLDLPVFTGGRLQANLVRARAQYEAAVASYREKVLAAFEEVENALASVRLLDEQAVAQRQWVAAAREQYDLALARFEQGLTHYIEVDTAESSWLTALLSEAQLQGERFIARVALIRALGGGWKESSLRSLESPQKDRSPGSAVSLSKARKEKR